jgi:hypothetical protein
VEILAQAGQLLMVMQIVTDLFEGPTDFRCLRTGLIHASTLASIDGGRRLAPRCSVGPVSLNHLSEVPGVDGHVE